MDNKQDRQFYWEVKDFLGKNNQSNSSKVSKPESLKECISKTIIKNDALYRPSIIPPAPLTEDIISSVNSLLSLNESHIKNNSHNITKSMFNLTEAPAPAFGGGSLSGGSGRSFDSSRRSSSSFRDRNPEQYQKNLDKQEELKTQRKANLDASIQRTKQDEAMKANRGGAGLALDNSGVPVDSAENREKLTSYRAEQDREKRATSIAKTIENVSGKDPSSLSSKEAAELQMAKIYTGGGSLSKGDSSLESRIRSKLDSSKLNADGSSKVQALQGPGQDGTNAADDAAKDVAMQKTLGRSTEDLANTSQIAIGRETQIKRQEDKAFADKVKEDRYQSMKDKVVQGTNMTYGDFEAKTGRRFNALDSRDSSLISNLAGAGSRGRSETAKQLDLTTDQFNRRYDEQNKNLAQRQGAADRAYDQSKFELDKFKNDPEYRKQVRNTDTANLMPRVQAQIAADEAKRVAAETAGREQARADKSRKTQADLDYYKDSIPSMGYNPRTPKPKPAENFVSRSEPEKPFLPTPTGDDNAANAAARSEVRNIERNRSTQTPTISTKKPNEYVSLINSFTSPKIGREPIAPGSKEDIDTQLKKLRGQ
jgi:hypothetical protein